MVSWRAEVATVPAERRGAARSRIDCPVRLHLMVGVRAGSLWDLSETGARIQLDQPPKVGAEALLKWQTYEAFCRVVWVTDDMCGIAFDRPLSSAMLDESLRQEEEERRPSGPVATVGNIPVGQKRSRR